MYFHLCSIAHDRNLAAQYIYDIGLRDSRYQFFVCIFASTKSWVVKASYYSCGNEP